MDGVFIVFDCLRESSVLSAVDIGGRLKWE
jgi:hypothetical protein